MENPEKPTGQGGAGRGQGRKPADPAAGAKVKIGVFSVSVKAAKKIPKERGQASGYVERALLAYEGE